MPIYAGATSLPESRSTVGSRAFGRDSAWWAFNHVSNYVDLKYSYMIKDVQALQAKFEGEALAMQPAIEQATSTSTRSILSSPCGS